MNYGITPHNRYKVRTHGFALEAVAWAKEHKSKGRYNYEGYLGATGEMWYFELEEDAILFALKFK